MELTGFEMIYDLEREFFRPGRGNGVINLWVDLETGEIWGETARDAREFKDPARYGTLYVGYLDCPTERDGITGMVARELMRRKAAGGRYYRKAYGGVFKIYELLDDDNFLMLYGEDEYIDDDGEGKPGVHCEQELWEDSAGELYDFMTYSNEPDKVYYGCAGLPPKDTGLVFESVWSYGSDVVAYDLWGYGKFGNGAKTDDEATANATKCREYFRKLQGKPGAPRLLATSGKGGMKLKYEWNELSDTEKTALAYFDPDYAGTIFDDHEIQVFDDYIDGYNAEYNDDDDAEYDDI